MSIFGVAVHNVCDESRPARHVYDPISHQMKRQPYYRTVASPKQNVMPPFVPNLNLVGKRIEARISAYQRYTTAARCGNESCRDDRPTHFLELAHRYNRRPNCSGTMLTSQRGSKVWEYYRDRDYSPERQLSTAFDTFRDDPCSRASSSCAVSRSATPREPRRQPMSDILSSQLKPKPPRPQTDKISESCTHPVHPSVRPNTARPKPPCRPKAGSPGRSFTAATREIPLVSGSCFSPRKSTPAGEGSISDDRVSVQRAIAAFEHRLRERPQKSRLDATPDDLKGNC